MIYSDIAIAAFGISIVVDLFVFKNSLLTRLAFWLSYMIILPFQLLTNWWLTHSRSDSTRRVLHQQIKGERMGARCVLQEGRDDSYGA